MTTAMHTLLDLALRQRDEALAALLQAEQAAQRLRLQSEQLHTYRGEYDQRGPSREGTTSPAELLHCHRNFMQRIEQALGQQQGHLQGAESRVVQLRGALLACETRVASLRKLLERQAQEQRRVTARLEQRRSDEAATQQRAHRLAGAAPAAY